MDHEEGDGDGAGLDGDVDGDSRGGGRQSPPEVIPTAFPPSDLLRRQPSVSLFLVWCFFPSPSGKRRGAFYRGVFRSRGCFWAKDRCKRGHEGRNR